MAKNIYRERMEQLKINEAERYKSMVGNLEAAVEGSHFGEGNWELEWVDNPKKHEGLMRTYELNQKLKEIATEGE